MQSNVFRRLTTDLKDMNWIVSTTWETQLTALSLSFLISKMGVLIVLILQGGCEDYMK